jgi:hypothetical protein
MPIGIEMSDTLRDKLKGCVPSEVIEALAIAMHNSGVDITAKVYSYGMERSFDEYGIEGVHMNTLYLLGNLRKWQGLEAQLTKRTLRRWRLPKNKI